MERRTLQGGSVASFVAVGIVIALIFVGSFYYLRIHGEQARNDQTVAQNNSDKTNDQNQGTISQDEKQDEDKTKEDDDKTPTDTGDADILPETGAESTVIQSLGAGLMTMSVIGFVLSRRKANRYL